ncbi:hypothetical protein BJP23_17445 [Aeromonas veronii bv. veronii]|nr:hypothetical protein BJP23_17445 [Aeromonas veronii bv. veronii]
MPHSPFGLGSRDGRLVVWRSRCAEWRGGCRFFLFLAYVCQAFSLQTVLSYRPNSLSAVWTHHLTDRRISPSCFHCYQICCRGLALRQPKCNLNSVGQGPPFTGIRRDNCGCCYFK